MQWNRVRLITEPEMTLCVVFPPRKTQFVVAVFTDHDKPVLRQDAIVTDYYWLSMLAASMSMIGMSSWMG
jgi:hypothetical protein